MSSRPPSPWLRRALIAAAALAVVAAAVWWFGRPKPIPVVLTEVGRGRVESTIANAAAFHAGKLSTGSEPFRPGILHRIDKNTTGILLIAKSDEAHWRVSLQFERRTVSKQYLAICEGELAKNEGVIDKPLAPVPSSNPLAGFGGSPPRQAMPEQASGTHEGAPLSGAHSWPRGQATPSQGSGAPSHAQTSGLSLKRWPGPQDSE